MSAFTVHLISDSTGGTLQGLADAAFSQFPDIDLVQKLWPQVRSGAQLERILSAIERSGPSIVLYTLVDRALIAHLHQGGERIGVRAIAVMAPLLEGLSAELGMEPLGRPGLQHRLDDLYFSRIEAIDFAMSFDDGQNYEGIETADVILVGVSRTSKTPTCVYLARQGIRAANIPLVPGVLIPEEILTLERPLFVGLTESPDRLIELRSSRLKIDQAKLALTSNAYVDPEKVEEEVLAARRFFRERKWPVLDVTKRSVEETAAEIMVLLQNKEVFQ